MTIQTRQESASRKCYLASVTAAESNVSARVSLGWGLSDVTWGGRHRLHSPRRFPPSLSSAPRSFPTSPDKGGAAMPPSLWLSAKGSSAARLASETKSFVARKCQKEVGSQGSFGHGGCPKREMGYGVVGKRNFCRESHGQMCDGKKAGRGNKECEPGPRRETKKQ